MTGVVRVGNAGHRGLPAHRRQGDDAVMQCDAAADDQVAAVRVGAVQLHIRFGEELQTSRGDLPAPRLRVVYGRCAGGQREDRSQGAHVWELGVHRCLSGQTSRPIAVIRQGSVCDL